MAPIRPLRASSPSTFIVCTVITLLAIAPAAAACGNAVVEAGEDCDDGSSQNGNANSCCTTACTFSGESPDVIVGELSDTLRYGTSDGITAYSIGTTSCNQGSCWLKWIANTPEHPVIGQNLFKLKNGRFEHIGQSWLKHGFTALAGNACFDDCVDPPNGSRLGVHCSDPYSAGLNGTQSGLGPKNDVNPATGVFPYPDPRVGLTGPVLYKRLQVKNSDLELSNGTAGQPLYFAEGQYVTRDDAEAKNNANNASYRRVHVGASPNFPLSLVLATQRQQAGIRAWQDTDPTVSEVDVPAAEGLFILAAQATDLGGGIWHYEYAVQNLTNNRAAGSFSVPIPPGAVITNAGFHDVDYHSAAPADVYDGTDWPATIGAGSVSWATTPHATNPNANALRWGTLYNFRFDANIPPGTGTVTIGLFKPGAVTTATATIVTPNICVGSPDGTACNDTNRCTLSDTCSSGACVGSNPVVCTPFDQCHDTGTCNPGTGVCSNPLKPNGSLCSDGNGCTQTDACQNGACAGSSPVVCTASDPCHNPGVCAPATGICSNPNAPNGTPCNDGDVCTESDGCQTGACQASPVTCVASDTCHLAGTCTTGIGCSNPVKPDGSGCDDANSCTENDVCSGGACAGTGLPTPEEVDNGVAVSESGEVATISWNMALGATDSSVLRGNVSALPVGPGDAEELCVPVGGMDTFTTDSEVPAVGECHWYLVRGTNACGPGTYGSAVIDGSPVTRSSTTCP